MKDALVAVVFVFVSSLPVCTSSPPSVKLRTLSARAGAMLLVQWWHHLRRYGWLEKGW